MREFLTGLIFLGILIFLFIGIIKYNENQSIKPIRNLSYESNEEIKPYIDKFFRDLNNHGIYPVIPKDFVFKFSDLMMMIE